MNQYYRKDLKWNYLGLHSSEIMEMIKNVKCDDLISNWPPRNSLDEKEGNKEREREREFFV